jgi:hypothetical protein
MIVNIEQFRQLHVSGRPVVYELKVHEPAALRLYVVRHGEDWAATHGRKKPKDKNVAKEVERARDLYERRLSP